MTIRDYFVYYSFNETNVTIAGMVDMRRNPDFKKN